MRTSFLSALEKERASDHPISMIENVYLLKRMKYVISSFIFLPGIITFFLVQDNKHLSPSYDNPLKEDIQFSQSHDISAHEEGMVSESFGEPERHFFQPAESTEFPFSASLRPQLAFWKKIFTEYTSNQVVIHDRKHLGIVYTVIDLTKKQVYEKSARRKALRSAKKKYKRMLLTLNSLEPKNIDTLGEEEKRILAMFKEVPGNYTFSRARRNMRIQYGLRDSLEKAIIRSGRYLKDMEKIFIENGLPVELTRLPFIESSFNIQAHSLAGAAGIWQFTLPTGKHYMRIDRFMDERRNPLKSTEAAAKLLKTYYRRLKSWPLAITAFNHGSYAMQLAIRETKTRDIATIINNYKGRTFGFSSRNFYVEFLAVLEILGEYRRYFGEVEFLPPEEYEEFILKDNIHMNTLLKHSSLDRNVIARLNPELSKSVLTSRRFVPKNYHLKIPAGMKETLENKYAMIVAHEHKRYANVKTLHRVRIGQSLSEIAELYNTSVKEIISANSLKDPDTLLKGQVLEIPTKA